MPPLVTVFGVEIMDELILAIAVATAITAVILTSRLNRHPPERDYDDEGKILAEVEVCQSYGRYDQAMEILKDALTKRPESPVYREKLKALRRSKP